MSPSKLTRLLIAVAFLVFYGLLSPVRLAYFNSLGFIVPLSVGIVALALATRFPKNGLSPTFLFLVSVSAHFVAIASFAFDHFLLRDTSSLSGLAESVGSFTIIRTFFVFPALSYVFLIFPLALVLIFKWNERGRRQLSRP